MTTTRIAAIVCATAVLSTTLPAGARPYPTNVCVGRKQAAAGSYCRRVLQAWAGWEKNGDVARRDDTIARAAANLDRAWERAETKAAAAGVDCADTTLGADGLAGLVDSASGAIVAAVNDGLDLQDATNRRCGRGIILAAGTKCARLLGAERSFVRNPARDPDGAKRDARQARAASAFSNAFARQRRKGCPTAATADGLEAQVDGAVADVVKQTTVSPNVADGEFTTISPTGTTEYLGQQITPTCIKSTPYHFFVKRGSVNRLLVYYQGGGACWDALTCGVPVCDPSVDPNGSDNPNFASSGFSDLTNPDNPFRDWNIVVVSYCSCDIHFGDAFQAYSPTVQIEHRGYHNSRIAEKWAREHFVTPEQVFVTGSSAGAYGAWFNAPLHHRVWPAAKFQVLADAGNGVITQEFLENYFSNWDFEKNIPPDIPGVLQALQDGTGIPGYTEAIANYFPSTRWAQYSTAYDGGSGGQTGFYNLMLNNNDPLAALTWWEGSCAFNAGMRQQAFATALAVPSNYRYYIGTGSRHTMWGSNKVYTDTTGGVPTLVDWVRAMLDGTPAWVNVEANDFGLLLPGDVRPNPLQPPFQQVGPDVKVVCNGGSPSGAFVE
jgi:hypothetical protein